MGLYDRYLATRIRFAEESLPETIALIISERDLRNAGADQRLAEFLSWSFGFGASRVVVYVSVTDEEEIPTIKQKLSDLRAPHPVAVRTPADESRATAPIQVSIGLGGKAEFAAAVKRIAESIAAGELEPADISATAIEERLVFPSDPDLIIKTGSERLSDFMIWQSVYSELYFTDVNWQNFRRRDYLRALRDFQERQRRFGT